jgi:hypothetical protein
MVDPMGFSVDGYDPEHHDIAVKIVPPRRFPEGEQGGVPCSFLEAATIIETGLDSGYTFRGSASITGTERGFHWLEGGSMERLLKYTVKPWWITNGDGLGLSRKATLRLETETEEEYAAFIASLASID